MWPLSLMFLTKMLCVNTHMHIQIHVPMRAICPAHTLLTLNLREN
jgi:hypothetical protein